MLPIMSGKGGGLIAEKICVKAYSFRDQERGETDFLETLLIRMTGVDRCGLRHGRHV